MGGRSKICSKTILTVCLQRPCHRVGIPVASHFTFLGRGFTRGVPEFVEEWPGVPRTEEVCRPT